MSCTCTYMYTVHYSLCNFWMSVLVIVNLTSLILEEFFLPKIKQHELYKFSMHRMKKFK